ncbi:hypothetical protein HMPREF3099_02905 [Kytococcus sp. HMSC28H12]|nr:hypothetical protein HMPREF3099_02905 [Kytococcus sp. HMSC28H12]
MTSVALRRVDIDRPETGGPRARTIYSTGSLAIQGIVRLAISVIVGRLAGPEALGQVMTGLSVASLLSLLWPSATGAAASRFVAAGQEIGDAEELRRVTGHLSRRTLVASLALAPAAVLYWALTHHDLLGAAVLGLLTLGLGGYAYARGVHTGARQVRRLVILDLAGSLLGLAGTVALAATGVHSVAVLAPLAVAYLAITATSWPPARSGAPGNASEMDHFVRWSTLGTVASAGLMQMVMVVAAHKLDGPTTGAFAAALNLISPAALLANSFALVLTPDIAAAFGRGDKRGAVETVRRSTEALVAVMVVIFGSAVLLAPWIVLILWGSAFHTASSIFALLSIGPLARAVAVPAVSSLSSRDRKGVEHAATSTIAGLVLALAIWWVAPLQGWMVVALGFSLAMVLTAAQNVVRAWRLDAHRWGATWVRLLLGVVAVGTATAVRDEQDWPLAMTLLVTAVMVGLWVVAHRKVLTPLLRR